MFDTPSLIQLPNGTWIDPAMVSVVSGGAIEHPIQSEAGPIAGRTVVLLVNGQSLTMFSTTSEVAEKLRDQIANDVLDAIHPFREKSLSGDN
jgi:hypothetical protein